MKTETAKKVAIKIASQEQQDNAKNTRKTLKVLQQTADDKENLTGRRKLERDSKMAVDQEVKRKKLIHAAIQTEPEVITADDLTSDKPSDEYWRRLAEKRGEALNDSLQENDRLKENIETLKEENRICKEMLDESKALVDVLQEMLSDHDASMELAQEVTE